MEFNDERMEPIPAQEPEIPEELPAPEAPETAEPAVPAEAPAAQEVIAPEPVSEPEPAPEPEGVSHMPEPEPVPVPVRKPRKKGGKGILAAVLALTLAAGCCGLTAWGVNRRWEQRMGALEAQMEQQLADLQGQIEGMQADDGQLEALQARIDALQKTQSGIGVSGSPASSTEGLNPSQVYAMNVNSVVAISNQSTTNIWGQVSETASSGTGFIISADGYILSNYHVVEDANRLTVITYMGDEYEAKLVGFDEMNDVAILKVDASGLDPVEIGSSDALIVGDQVVAIGNPLGELTSSLTVGYISAKDRTINTDGNLINMMQTDAAINPGNSGGPLFNMKGEVVGITTAKYSGSTGSGASIEGIGFAIPIADVMAMTGDLISHGYLTNQAYLGVSVMDLDESTADLYSLPAGSYVQSVVAGSCAEKAGILPKDIIIAVGGYAIEGNSTLQTALRKFRAGDTTTITVYRAGAEVELTITFDERPQDPYAGQQTPQTGEMPSSGSYEDWYNYFSPFFGGGMP